MLSTSKENGGFLASMGLKKGEGNDESIIDDSQEEDPHKKSDLFDTSKDKIAKGGKVHKGMESDEDEFDLGFGSNKKGKDEGGIYVRRLHSTVFDLNIRFTTSVRWKIFTALLMTQY